ncbi:MAG: hypothetical protein JJU27_14760 [Gammaproteobacteria bacterium]|nr:hypothetical protein [Gammaproteobacteria bacterium]
MASLAAAGARARLGHAWLLHGPPGTGKLRLAEALGRALVGGFEPKDWAGALHEDMSGQPPEPAKLPDLYWLTPLPDKRSIGVDQVRALIEQLGYTSHGGGARVVIVSLAEEMTTSAANSLLKTLEEPPPGVYLLLVSHAPGRLPATIRSRCQRLAILPPSSEAAIDWLSALEPARNWQSLLELAGGAPLRALAMAQAGLDRLDETWCDELAELMAQGGDLPGRVESWLKGDPAGFLDWLQTRLSRVLCDLALQSGGSTDQAHAAYARLLGVAATRSARRLFELHDGVRRLRRLVDGGINIALGLEALLVTWRRAA